MNQEVEKKIEELIEGSKLDAIKPYLKGAGVAALGGALGAGLDVYFNNGKNIDDYIKPLFAWGLGSAVSGAAGAKPQKDQKPEQENIEME
jgi:hypothetical protein